MPLVGADLSVVLFGQFVVVLARYLRKIRIWRSSNLAIGTHIEYTLHTYT